MQNFAYLEANTSKSNINILIAVGLHLKKRKEKTHCNDRYIIAL